MADRKYTGSEPADFPTLGLVDVQPGDVVDVPHDVNHPDFEPVKKPRKPKPDPEPVVETAPTEES